MTKRNKNELDTVVDSTIVPTVTNAIHRDFLKDEVLDSAEMKERRVVVAAMTTDSYSLNFTDDEMYDIDCNDRTMSFTVSNLSEGQSGYVRFTDFSGGSISFSNVTLLGNNRDNGRCVAIPSEINMYKIVNIRGIYFGYFVGQDALIAPSFDWEDLHALNIDMELKSAVAWSNGPFVPSSLYTIHLQTTVSLVFNTNQYATMYEATIMDFSSPGDIQKFYGHKIHTASLVWLEATLT